jgi:hypothetical protein
MKLWSVSMGELRFELKVHGFSKGRLITIQTAKNHIEK